MMDTSLILFQILNYFILKKPKETKMKPKKKRKERNLKIAFDNANRRKKRK